MGGIAELPDVSGSSGGGYIALAAAAGLGVVTLAAAGGWYARRRWLG